MFAVPLAALSRRRTSLIFLRRSRSAIAQRRAIAARHPAVEEVFLPAADGTRLHAWHVKGAPQAPLVIYFGGNAEERRLDAR